MLFSRLIWTILLHAAIAKELGLEETLHGHTGCVNRLAWNEDGTLLASGSDDLTIIVR